jgi:hypothetical protein
MITKVCIIGGRGNMASRYRAIFAVLGVEVVVWDIGEKPDVTDVEGFLVATPTPTHLDILKEIIPLKKPILCEKPVVKTMFELLEIRRLCEEHGTPFQVVMQYCWLVDAISMGETRYDYFKHGNDGLVWDCFQIIALSKGPVELGEKSPIWDCVINGIRLNIGAMDFAYIEMLKSWLERPSAQPWDFIIESHQKVLNYAEKHTDSNTSTLNIN